MNVLFSCAGRRNYLLQFFREILGEGRILASDNSPDAPALQAADHSFLAPPVTAPDYIPRLLEWCVKEDVDMIVPLNDHDLPILARHRDDFLAEGVLVLVASESFVDICFDKWKSAAYFSRMGLKTPLTFLDVDSFEDARSAGRIDFPAILKPRWGSGSLGLEIVETEEDLRYIKSALESRLRRHDRELSSRAGEVERILIQEFIDGAEYGLDIVNDLEGNHRGTYCKLKRSMRSGETDKSQLVYRPDITELATRLGNDSGHIGNLDCDVFERDGEFYFLEMNPRFGGGYPFSHMAGANLPQCLVDWYGGGEASLNLTSLDYDAIYAKYDLIIQVTGDARHTRTA